jgi:hypothetical protein
MNGLRNIKDDTLFLIGIVIALAVGIGVSLPGVL